MRAATEDLSEEELAVFDLLTKPDPALTEEEREQVKGVAKRLLAHVHEKLVLDWRRKAETMADVRVAIRDVLDELPDGAVPARRLRREGAGGASTTSRPSYGDDGVSAYDRRRSLAVRSGRGR